MIQAKKDSKVPGQPPGTKLMPESERLQTLTDLEENKKKVNLLLQKMPISMQSLHLQNQKKELEDKLIIIDKSIAMMTRKHVFIAE